MIGRKNRRNRIFKTIATGVVCLFLVNNTLQEISFADFSSVETNNALATNTKIHGLHKGEDIAHFIVRAIRQIEERENKPNQDIPDRVRELLGDSEVGERLAAINWDADDSVFVLEVRERDSATTRIFRVRKVRKDREEEWELDTTHKPYDVPTHQIAQDGQVEAADHVSLNSAECDRLYPGLRDHAIAHMRSIAEELDGYSKGLGLEAMKLVFVDGDESNGLRMDSTFKDRTFINVARPSEELREKEGKDARAFEGFPAHAGKRGMHIDERHVTDDEKLRKWLRHETLAHIFPYPHRRDTETDQVGIEEIEVEMDKEQPTDRDQTITALLDVKKIEPLVEHTGEERDHKSPRDLSMAKKKPSASSRRKRAKKPVPSTETPDLLKSGLAVSKLSRLDRLFQQFECQLEIAACGLTRRDRHGNGILVDIVLPREKKILRLGERSKIGQLFMTGGAYLFNNTLFGSNHLNLELRDETLYLVSDNEDLSSPLHERDWYQFGSVLCQLAHLRSVPSYKEILNSVSERGSLPLDLDWDIIAIGPKQVVMTEAYHKRLEKQKAAHRTKGLSADYHVHYHQPETGESLEDRLAYSRDDLIAYAGSVQWAEIRSAKDMPSPSKTSEMTGKVYHVPSELNELRRNLFRMVPYFDNSIIRMIVERDMEMYIPFWIAVMRTFSPKMLREQITSMIASVHKEVATLADQQVIDEVRQIPPRRYTFPEVSKHMSEEEIERLFKYMAAPLRLFQHQIGEDNKKAAVDLRQFVILSRYVTIASQINTGEGSPAIFTNLTREWKSFADIKPAPELPNSTYTRDALILVEAEVAQRRSVVENLGRIKAEEDDYRISEKLEPGRENLVEAYNNYLFLESRGNVITYTRQSHEEKKGRAYFTSTLREYYVDGKSTNEQEVKTKYETDAKASVKIAELAQEQESVHYTITPNLDKEDLGQIEFLEKQANTIAENSKGKITVTFNDPEHLGADSPSYTFACSINGEAVSQTQVDIYEDETAINRTNAILNIGMAGSAIPDNLQTKEDIQKYQPLIDIVNEAHRSICIVESTLIKPTMNAATINQILHHTPITIVLPPASRENFKQEIEREIQDMRLQALMKEFA